MNEYFEEDIIATPSDACREYARNVGAEHPDLEWILSPYDSWERNPFYTGKPGPYPEHENGMYDITGLESGETSDEELDRMTAPSAPEEDDVPF